MAYRLFSQANSTGSRHSAARFMHSWNSPSATAPSPNRHTVTASRLRMASASASPVATGIPPATMALPPKKRCSASNRCMDPPRPWLTPVLRPNISAMMASIGMPRAMAWPCSR